MMKTYPAKYFTWNGTYGITDASDLKLTNFPKGSPTEPFYFRDSFVVLGKVEDVVFNYCSDFFSGRGEDLEFAGANYVSECGRFTISIYND